jgi:hypothetical protein
LSGKGLLFGEPLVIASNDGIVDGLPPLKNELDVDFLLHKAQGLVNIETCAQ